MFNKEDCKLIGQIAKQTREMSIKIGLEMRKIYIAMIAKELDMTEDDYDKIDAVINFVNNHNPVTKFIKDNNLDKEDIMTLLESHVEEIIKMEKKRHENYKLQINNENLIKAIECEAELADIDGDPLRINRLAKVLKELGE